MNFDKIREQVDIVELVSQYLALKKTGLNFKGLCPFHSEKTPSFVVSPQKQIFHCFGCGKGGDVIKFVSEIEGLNYFEAGLKLAKDYRIQIDIKDDKGINDYFKITELVAKIFHENLLKNIKDDKIRLFLEKRKIKPEVIEKFYIGYAPDDFEFLFKILKKKKVNIKLSEELGLIKKKSNYYDTFRNRIIFPIRNLRGDFIAFGGRTLNDEIMPKYLNSPESPIFHKRKNLYGIFENKNEIKNNNEAIVVEGYMDLISLYSEGVKNCVASLGTAFTEEQLNLLNRFVENVYFLYDADKAGVKASIKGAVTAINKELSPKLILLPEGLDPDDFIKKYGLEEFIKLKKESNDLVYFLKNIIFKQIDLKNFENKNRLMKRLKKIYTDIDNPVYKDHFIKGIGEILNIDYNEIKKYFSKISPTGFKKFEIKKEKRPYHFSIEEKIVSFILTYNEFLDNIELEYFDNNLYRDLLLQFKNGVNLIKFLENDKISDEQKELIRLLSVQEIVFENDTDKEKYFNDVYRKLKETYLEKRKKEITEKIKSKEKEQDFSELPLLMEKKLRIAKELSKVKGG